MKGLAAFALRHALPPWLVAALVFLLFLAARAAGATPLLELDAHASALQRALERANAWSLLFAFAPLLWLRVAELGTQAAGRWLAPTGAPPALRSLGLFAGAALAAALVVTLAGVVTELNTASAPAAWRRARVLDNRGAVLLDEAPRVAWSAPELADGERLRVWTTVAPGSGPAISARLWARSAAGTSTVEARVAGRTALELDPGSGALELELERVGPGALLVLFAGAEVLAPARSERLASLALAGHAWLVLAAGCALSLGLARALRPALAAGLVLALALVVCTRAHAFALLPGASLSATWSDVTGGLVPAAAPALEILGALGLCALGVSLHARGTAGVRR
ncbi:MAG: hypothetical protein EXS08_00515 [Planctomycetes bacterium]|nr:hypothetical protein [Planctomycetota bacterium]